MDAKTYMQTEHLLMVTCLGLVLLLVWLAMYWLKDYARYVHRRTIKAYKQQGGK